MNVKININGRSFRVTSEGYELLKSQIDSIISNRPENIRSVAQDDLENRLADYFATLSPADGLLDIDDVKNAFAAVGFGCADNGSVNSGSTSSGAFQQTSGAQQEQTHTAPQPKKQRPTLYRSTHAAVVAGVCGGLGDWLGLDRVWMRIIFMLATLFISPLIIPLYVLLWIVVPPISERQLREIYGDGVRFDNQSSSGSGCMKGCLIVITVFLVLFLLLVPACLFGGVILQFFANILSNNFWM